MALVSNQHLLVYLKKKNEKKVIQTFNINYNKYIFYFVYLYIVYF